MFFRFTFAIFYGVFWAISRLPFSVLYVISDILYVVLYKIAGYRKKVAYQNLKRAFPEKSETEIQQILSAFYRHLCDLFVEFLKIISISEEDLSVRVKLLNPEMIDELNEQKEGVLMLATHYGNFEWMSCRVDMTTQNKCYGIYSPLTNKYFEHLAVKTRQRWQGELLPMRDAIRNSLNKLNEPCIIGFICDQSPSRRQTLYFTQFLGQTTAVHDRFAHLALMKPSKVYFADMRKVKRGHYTLEILALPMERFLPYSEENAQRFTDYHVGLLEQIIRKQPEFWLWTHKRWKHQPMENDILSEKLKEN